MPAIIIQTNQQTDAAALAEAAFVHVPSFLPESSYVCVGDTIDTDQQEGFLRCYKSLVYLSVCANGFFVSMKCYVGATVLKLWMAA